MTIIEILRDLHTPGSVMKFQISDFYFRTGGSVLPSVYDSSDATSTFYPMLFSNGRDWLTLNHQIENLYEGL